MTHSLNQILCFIQIAQGNAQTINLNKSLAGVLQSALKPEQMSEQFVYQSILKRLPRAESNRPRYADFGDMANDILRCLESEEFCAKFPEIITNEYRTLHKIFLIHVPKTAGSYIRHWFKTNPNYFVWDKSYEVPETSFARPGLVEMTAFSQNLHSTLCFTGHYQLNELFNRKLIKANDHVFTVVRDPIELILSALNYILTNLADDPYGNDSREWRLILDKTNIFDIEGSRVSMHAAANAILFSDLFFSEFQNNIVRYLGSNTIESALNNLTNANVDVVSIENLERYLAEKFGITGARERINVSKKYVTSVDELGVRARAYIYDVLCLKDIAFFHYISSEMLRIDRPYVRIQ